MSKFPIFRQLDQKDCDPTCLQVICKFYGKSYHLPKLVDLVETTREGSSLLGLSSAAETLGFRTVGIKVGIEN